MDDGAKQRFVTNSELKDELDTINRRIDKLPTDFQVKFYIVVAIVGSQLIPAADIAKAAVSVIP